ncbi:MAG: hypothetical protein WCZ87_01960 [Thiohalobacteraceae bacterium]
MTMSLVWLSALVGIAILITLASTVVLLGLLIRDWKKRTLW